MNVLDRLFKGTNKNDSQTPNHGEVVDLDTPRGSGHGPVMRLQVSLFELGRQRAISSGALKPKEEDLKTLREHAEAMARETRRELYNPVKRHEHRLREDEHQKVLSDRSHAEDALKFAAADVRQKEEQLARLPVCERPKASLLLMWALVIGIAGTITPTIHDFLFSSIEDSVLAWFFAAASAGFLAAVIVWSILGSISAAGRTAANWMGLFAGLIISAGLGLLRWSSATETEEVILAVALTLLEIGLVVIAEWVASGLRHHFVEWREQQIAYDQATAAVNAARGEYERRRIALDDLNCKVRAHIEFVQDNDLRNINVNELIAAAVKAVSDGYNDGTAFNQGITRKAGGAQ